MDHPGEDSSRLLKEHMAARFKRTVRQRHRLSGLQSSGVS